MFARPVAEVASLRGKAHRFDSLPLKPGDNPLPGLTGNLFDVRAEAEVGDSGVLAFNIAGTPVVYDGVKKALACGDVQGPLPPEGNIVRLRILVDRGSIEVFGNDGRVAISRKFTPNGDKSASLPALSVSSNGPQVKIRSLQVDELESAWK